MAVFSIQCPECNAVLKSSKPVPAGKQITCPKCDVMFAAPAPRPAKQVVEEVEVVEDDYDAVEIVDESPAKKTAVAVKPKKRRPQQEFRKKKNPWPMILGITGGIFGVAVLVVGGYFAFKFLSFSRTNDPLAYAPENPGMMFGADLGQLINNPQFGPMIEGALNTLPPLAQYKQGTSIDYKSSADKLFVGMGQFVGGQPGTTSVALSSKTALNKEKLAEALGVKEATVGGRRAYELKPSPMQTLALIVPSPNLAAFYMGHPNNLDEAVRLGGKSMPKPDTEKMMNKAAKGDAWIVMDLAIPGIRDQLTGTGPLAAPAMREMMNNIICIGAWAKIDGADVDLNLHLLAPTPAAAKTLSDQMKSASALLQLIAGGVGGAGGTGAQKDAAPTETIEGSTVILTTRVKLDSLKSAVDQASRFGNMLPAMGPGGGNDPRGGRGGRPGGR